MTQATTATNKTNTAKHPGGPSGLHQALPKFNRSKSEMPAAFQELADMGAAQAKDTFEKARATAEEATDLLKGTYAIAAKAATDYNLKVLEIARANTNSAFDYALALSGMKSLSELVELSTTHVRKQFEVMTAQTKELTELGQKVTAEIAVPIKAGVAVAFHNAAPGSAS